MRLNHQEIRAEQPCCVCRTSFTVEGDVTLPGSLRETTHVLYVSAMPVVEKAEAIQDRISAGGRVVFCVLYTQGENSKVESIEATADFAHLCDAPGCVPRAEVFSSIYAEDASASVTGGRMTMRAQLNLCARAVSDERMDAVAAVDAEHVQQKTTRVQLKRISAKGRSDVLLREEFSLPEDLAVQDTLGAWASASFTDTAGGQGRIGLAGEVTIEAIHASAMPGNPLVMTRHTVPVSQSVEVSGEEGSLLDGRITVKDVAVASQDMGNGERALRAEVLLGLEAWANQAESIDILTDAYTTQGDDLLLTRSTLRMRTGDRRMQAAESGKTPLLLPEGAKPVRTMLAAFASPVLKAFNQQGSRLVTEGTLQSTLIYLSSDGDVPVSARVEAPFRTAFAATAAPEDVITLRTANVEAIPVTSDRVELRYVLHAEVEGLQTERIPVVTEVSAIPAAEPTGDIVLYFTQPGEDTWDIARRYRLAEQDLHILNPDLQGAPEPGQGVIVWRRRII